MSRSNKVQLGIMFLLLSILLSAVACAEPYISISSANPSEGAILSSGQLTLSMLVNTNLTSVACNLSLDDSIVSTFGPVTDGETVEKQLSVLPGTHTWEGQCEDGSVSATTGEMNLTAVDLAAPQITLLSPADGTATAEQQVTFQFQVDDETGLHNCSLLLDGVQRAMWDNPETGVLERTLSVSEQTHSWTVRCADNTSSRQEGQGATWSFLADRTAPTVNIVRPSDGFETTLETVVFNISADDASDQLDCVLTIDSTEEAQFSVDSGSSHRTAVLVSPGNHSFVASCTDSANNSVQTTQAQFTRFDMDLSDLLLDISTDKESYSPGEPLDILVDATEGTTVNVVITREGTVYYNYTYIHGDDPSPPGVFLNTAGTYTLSATATFLELEKSDNDIFLITNSSQGLLCSISAEETAQVGTEHEFTGTAYNAFGTVSYEWDFDSDGTTDAVGQSKSHSFSSPGVKNVRLKVSDSLESANCSITLQAEQTYTLTLSVLDNVTGSTISAADVETANTSATTGTDGVAYLYVSAGSHFLLVSKSGYDPYYQSVDVNQNKSLVVKLQERFEDNDAPTIAIESPKQNDEVGGSPVDLIFSVQDASTVQCTLFFSPYSGWWSVEDDDITLQPSSGGSSPVDHTHSLESSNMSDGTYYWKVECEDIQGNLASSGNLSFLYSKTAQAVNSEVLSATGSESGEETGSALVLKLIDKLDSAISRARSISPEESEVFEILEIPSQLDKQKTTMIKIQNDYFARIDPVTRQETEDNLDYFEEEYLQIVEGIEQDTPVDAEVLDSVDFMKYEFTDDIEESISAYLEFKGEEKTGKQLEGIVDEINDLQAEITISTSASLVEITYLSGETKNITLVMHAITFKNDSLVSPKSIFLENIPKSIAESTDDIEFLSNFQVLNKDPLIRLYPDSDNHIIYSIEGHVDLENVKDISTLVLEQSILDSDGTGRNRVTGFSVGGLLSGRGGLIAVILGFIAVMSLGIVLLQTGTIAANDSGTRLLSKLQAMNLDLTGTWDSLKRRGEHKESLKEVDELVEEMDLALEKHRHEKAKLIFREIRGHYTNIPPKYQDDFKTMLTEFSTRLNKAWAEELLDKALQSIETGDARRAKNIYGTLSKVYLNLGTETKAEILPATNKLLGRIQGHEIQSRMDQIERMLRKGKRRQAKLHYKQVQQLYGKLPKEEKRRVYKRVVSLRKRL